MAIFTMTDLPKPTGEAVALAFTVNGPARFELRVDENGSTHLFGYSGTEDDDEQDPNIVFDTDGSFGVFTDDEA